MKKFAKAVLIIGTGLPGWFVWYQMRAAKKQQTGQEETRRNGE